MARTRSWWSRRTAMVITSTGEARDLLGGSTLAVPGATVQRCIGRLELKWEVEGVSFEWPSIRLGILVTDNPDPALLDASNDLDWLYFSSAAGRPWSTTAGVVQTTDPADPALMWDVAGQRTMGTGESVWLLMSPFGAATTPAPRGSQFSRVLILGPDV